MAWPTFTVDVTQNSNKIKVYGAVPASSLSQGFEAIVNGIDNLEISYGTDLMYEGDAKTPYSDLFLVRPYTGQSKSAVELIVKPTGSQFNNIVDIFRKGTDQSNQLMSNYYQFCEGDKPITHQPLDENAPAQEIQTLPMMEKRVDESISNLSKDFTDKTASLTTTVSEKIGEMDSKVTQAKSDFDGWRGSVQAKDINGEPSYKSVINLTGLSTDYFYPVWWRMPSDDEGVSKISIFRIYYADSEKDPFGDGDSHLAGLNMELEGACIPWDGGANFLTLKRLSQTYRKTVRKISFDMMCIARHVDGSSVQLMGNLSDGQITSCLTRSGLYLRGGLNYQLSKNFPSDIYYSRENEEVQIDASQQQGWEISWRVKPYHIDDATLGGDYEENRLAYQYDYDRRYVSKNDFSAQTALIESDISALQADVNSLKSS